MPPIVSQEWGDKLIVFFYDEIGSPIGYAYRTTSMAANTFYYYVYEKNLQGDIVAVYSTNGVKLVTYTYDAWGNVTKENNQILTGTYAGAGHNPFLYRGYYYDNETKLYYLNSRYYDPSTGRFLNADGYLNANGDLIGFNMFAYCSNNPVMYTDSSGEAIESIFDIVSLGLSVVEVCINPTDVWAWIGLAGDVVDLIPFVTGVGEITDAIRISDAVLDSADTIHDLNKSYDIADDAIDSYRNLKKISKGTGKEVHHIIERRLGKALKIENTNEMLSVVLDRDTHRMFTNKWRKAIPYGTKYSSINKGELWGIAVDIYKGYPELLKAAKKTIYG